MTERGFFTIKGAAHWASVSPKTVQRWIASGLPAYRAGPGTKVLILPSDIKKFLTREQHQTPSLDALVNETVAELKEKQKGMKAIAQKRSGDLTP